MPQDDDEQERRCHACMDEIMDVLARHKMYGYAYAADIKMLDADHFSLCGFTEVRLDAPWAQTRALLDQADRQAQVMFARMLELNAAKNAEPVRKTDEPRFKIYIPDI